MKFNEKLQRLRKQNGLSQEQLAEKLNVSRQAVSKWEMGTIPDIDNIIKISRFFDCSLDYLMNNEAAQASTKSVPSQPEQQPKKKSAPWLIAASISLGLGIIGLLIIGIFSSVHPAVLYDPPEGEVRMIIATGLSAFLQVHNITWLFVLCCILALSGAVAAVLYLKKEKSR